MTQTGKVYGEALYDLAKDSGIAAEVLQELEVLLQAFTEEPAFLRLLGAPTLTKQERCGIVDDSFRGKVQPYLLNFMKILTQKGYMRHFPDCCAAYRACYNRDNGILPVTAVSAIPLNEAQLCRLRQKLATLTGKTIALTNTVDAACLGGVRLDFDGRRLDDTVAHRLDEMARLLKNTVL